MTTRRSVARRLCSALIILGTGCLLVSAGPDPRIITIIEKIHPLAVREDFAGMLRETDAALAAFAEPGAERGLLLSLKAEGLLGLGRSREALIAMDDAVAMLPADADVRLRHAEIQRAAGQPVEAARTVVFIADTFPDRVADLNIRWIGSLLREVEDDNSARFELTMALASRRYDVPGEPGRADWIVAEAIRGLVERDRANEAEALVARLIDSSTIIELMIDRDQRALWPTLEAKAGPKAKTALEAELAAVEAAWRADPQNVERITDYARNLRLLGRPSDAIKLGESRTSDIAAIEKLGEDGFWLVNTHAQSLAEAGRVDEADALFTKLLALGLETHPSLISMAINHSSLLLERGRAEQALAAANKLDALTPTLMSDYGRMLVWKTQTCANEALGRAGPAAAALARMQEKREGNPAVLMIALLCTDKLAAAESLILQRLDEPDHRGAMLAALQDFDAATPNPFADGLRAKLMRLRDRPAVRKAIERRGRIMTIAAPHVFWGGL